MREVASDKVAGLSAQAAAHPDVERFVVTIGAVDMLEGDKALVAAGHLQPPPQRRKDCGPARRLGDPVLPEIPIKMLVVTHLVFGNMAGQHRTDRIRARAGQGAIIARSAGFYDAA